MLRRALTLAGAALLGACAAAPTAPPLTAPPPAPVIISDEAQAETADDLVAPPEAVSAGPQKPQQTEAGRFRVGVASLESAEAAAPWVSKLQAAGFRTEVLPVTIEGRTWHRVLLPGYQNLEEARAVIPFVEEELGVKGVWVTSRRRAPTPEGAPAAAAEPAPAPAAPEPAAEPAAAPEPPPAN